MKKIDILGAIKKITDLLPKRDIEKLTFKALLVIWIIVIIVVVILRVNLGTGEDIEKRITDAATLNVPKKTLSYNIEDYKTTLGMVKEPEGIGKYASAGKRDPFSEYTGISIATASTDHDFVLRDISRVPLPMVYKGYIELPNKVIGQINWRKQTKFVQPGSALNGFRIISVGKDVVIASDESGKRIEFKLNRPVYSDALQAVLYDNISEDTFSVQLASVIDDYKVIDITLEYVILLSNGVELKLQK